MYALSEGNVYEIMSTFQRIRRGYDPTVKTAKVPDIFYYYVSR